MTRDEVNALRPGSNHYMAYVGWPKLFEQIGQMQFDLLKAAGMHEDSRVLDIGCGSLRAGMHIIPFLNPGNYFGLEPNKWLIQEGIDNLFEEGVIEAKQPCFDYNADFELTVFDCSFDYIIAQSIFSHLGPAKIRKCTASAEEVLMPRGIFLATFVLGNTNYQGTEWVYPSCVKYKPEYIKKLASGLKVQRLAWPQGARQTWYALTHPDMQLDQGFIKRTV